MGTHGIGEMNENGEMFADLCSFNRLIIEGSVFPHRRIHKATSVFCPGFQKGMVSSEKGTFSAVNGPTKGHH